MLASVVAAEVRSPTSLFAREALLDALTQLLLRLVRTSSDTGVERRASILPELAVVSR
jgi:hypothetical protein